MDAHQAASVLRIAWTTVENEEDAGKLAHGIVESRLAACAQIDGPIRSIYPWKGKIESTTEFRIWLKYPAKNESDLQTLIHRIHPYEVPQWVTVDASSFSAGYFDWVKEATL